MPITREEFERRTEIELDLRVNKARQWVLNFMTEHKDEAYTVGELTELMPKENIKKNAKHPESAVHSAMIKLVANGLVTRKASYFIRDSKNIDAKIQPSNKNKKIREKSK